MMPSPRWAVGSNQYRKRPRPAAGEPAVTLPAPSSVDRERTRMCAIDWDESIIDVDGIHRSTVDRARARFRAQLPELVWNAAALEGNTYTLPEVRTLLEGVTVGGKRVEEAEQVLDLSEAYARLDEMVGAGTFRLDKATSDELHAILARHEALDAGGFRGEGTATGGGHVRLSDGTRVEGVDTGPAGANLRRRVENLLAYIEAEPDPRMQALVYFASATRTQFYFDGNKRTARLMMTGHLMSGGFDAVSVPAARRLEFNQALDTLFATDDATTLMVLLATCTLD
jgi:Fic family protein